MLLQLDGNKKNEIDMLLEYAKQQHINLSVIDGGNSEFYLPGKPLTDEELTSLITKSRNSGVISLTEVHQTIRSNYNAD
jgi:hypothetical protein